MSVIETKKLNKVFGPVEAVKDVSFRVEAGEVLGFLGPNGAGKSTVMRMLTCFLTPTSGTATVADHDILNDPIKVREIVGYVPETNPVYADMTTQSFLRFVGEMRGYKGAELKKRVESVVQSCRLDDVLYRNLDNLSKGFKRRVGLAQSLIHDPSVLILDEPTDGLDPNQKHEVRALIQRMAPEKCIVVSTHILEEVDAVCSRAIIIAEGKIVADDTPAGLKKRSKYYGTVHLAIRANGETVGKDVFEAIPDVEAVEVHSSDDACHRFTIMPREGKSISNEVVTLAHDRKWTIQEISVEDGRLDEVFRSITMEGGKRS